MHTCVTTLYTYVSYQQAMKPGGRAKQTELIHAMMQRKASSSGSSGQRGAIVVNDEAQQRSVCVFLASAITHMILHMAYEHVLHATHDHERPDVSAVHHTMVIPHQVLYCL